MESALDESADKVDLIINVSENEFSTESENVSPGSSFPTSGYENMTVTFDASHKSAATKTGSRSKPKTFKSPIRFPKRANSSHDDDSINAGSVHLAKRAKVNERPELEVTSQVVEFPQQNLICNQLSDEEAQTGEETTDDDKLELDGLNSGADINGDPFPLMHNEKYLQEEEEVLILVSKLDVSNFVVLFDNEKCNPTLKEKNSTVIDKDEVPCTEPLTIEVAETCNDDSFSEYQLLEHYPALSDNDNYIIDDIPNSANNVMTRLGEKVDISDEEEYAEASRSISEAVTLGQEWNLQTLPDPDNASVVTRPARSVLERLGKKVDMSDDAVENHAIVGAILHTRPTKETEEIGPEWNEPEAHQTCIQNRLAEYADCNRSGFVFARLSDHYVPSLQNCFPANSSLDSGDVIGTPLNDEGSESELVEQVPSRHLSEDKNELAVSRSIGRYLLTSPEDLSASPPVGNGEAIPLEKVPLPFIAEDPMEERDNNDPEWQNLCMLNSDDERYNAVRARWKNVTIPNPNQNLTCNNYRKRLAKPDINANFSIENPRKRHLTETVEEPRAKRLRTRSSAPTISLFDTKIDNIELEFHDEMKMLKWQYQRRMCGIEEQYSRKFQSIGPYFYGEIMAEKNREMRAITHKYEAMGRKIFGQREKNVAKVKNSEVEIMAVQKRYFGHDADGDALSPDMMREMSDIDAMYSAYDRFYANNG